MRCSVDKCLHPVLGTSPGTECKDPFSSNIWLYDTIMEDSEPLVSGAWDWTCSGCGLTKRGNSACCGLTIEDHVNKFSEWLAKVLELTGDRDIPSSELEVAEGATRPSWQRGTGHGC